MVYKNKITRRVRPAEIIETYPEFKPFPEMPDLEEFPIKKKITRSLG